MIEIKKQRFESIDAFRLLCAIMVVIMHTKPVHNPESTLGVIIISIFPRIAMPFFFAIMGYFYLRNLDKNPKSYLNYIWRLIKVYILWTIVYFILSIISLAYKNFDFFVFLKIFLLNTITFGSYFHFWFFPAIFFGLIVLKICHKFKILKHVSIFCVIFYIIGLFGSTYYDIGIKIPVIVDLINWVYYYEVIQRVLALGLNFMFMGYWLKVWVDKKDKNNKKNVILLIIFFILFIAEFISTYALSIPRNIKLSIFIYPLTLVLIRLLLDNNNNFIKKIANPFRCIANIMYYSHPLVIFMLNILNNKFWSIEKFNTLCFVLTIIVCCFIGLIWYLFCFHFSKNKKKNIKISPNNKKED